MYEIEGWTNNAGSGDLNYYNLYNNPAEGGYEEALNYVPSSGTTQSGGGYTTSWGGNETQPSASGWQPTAFGSTSTPTQTLSMDGSGGGSTVRSSGSSGVQVLPSTLMGTKSTTQYIGGGALPTMQTASMRAPAYNLPTYDYGRINFLAQQQAAPLYTKARNALTTGIGKVASTDNPYMQAQARKQLLSGYGGGISEIAAGAARTGAQLYAPEYAGQMQKAGTEYGGQLAAAQANMQAQQNTYSNQFQAAMQEWQKSLQTVTTEERDYGQGYNTGETSGTYTPSGLKYNDPNFGKTYKSRADYIASGDYARRLG